MAKVKVSVAISSAQCSVFVQGMDFTCPLCTVLVRSGEHHECRTTTKPPKKKAVR